MIEARIPSYIRDSAEVDHRPNREENLSATAGQQRLEGEDQLLVAALFLENRPQRNATAKTITFVPNLIGPSAAKPINIDTNMINNRAARSDPEPDPTSIPAWPRCGATRRTDHRPEAKVGRSECGRLDNAAPLPKDRTLFGWLRMGGP